MSSNFYCILDILEDTFTDSGFYYFFLKCIEFFLAGSYINGRSFWTCRGLVWCFGGVCCNFASHPMTNPSIIISSFIPQAWLLEFKWKLLKLGRTQTLNCLHSVNRSWNLCSVLPASQLQFSTELLGISPAHVLFRGQPRIWKDDISRFGVYFFYDLRFLHLNFQLL